MRWASLVCSVSIALSTLCLAQRKTVRVPSKGIPAYFKAFESREDKDNFTRAVLRNGLTVLIEEQALHPLAAVVTYVKVGHLHEDDKVLGITNLVRRLSIKETAKHSKGEIVREVRQLGGSLTGHTSQDRTCYYGVAPMENVGKMLEIQADLLRNPSFSPPSVAQEISALLEKSQRQLQIPLTDATRRLLQLTYRKHRLRRWPLGTEETLSKIGREELLEFHQTHYRPDNVILAISGAVRRERILEKVVELYASMKPSTREAVSARGLSEPAQASFRYQHLRGTSQQAHLLLGYPVPGTSHPDYGPLLLLSYILGRGRAALLHNYLVESGTALTAECKLEAFRQGGTFFISLTLEAEQAGRAEMQALAQLQVLRQQGIAKADLDRAKALVLKDFYESLEGVDQRAYRLAHSEVLGSYLDRESFPRRIDKVSAGQVSRVVQRYLKESKLSLVEYFPEQAEPRTFTAQSFLEAMRLLVPAEARRRWIDLEAQYAALPKFDFELPQFRPSHLKSDLRRTSILRGPEIYFREEHGVPLVHVGFFFPGGRVHESASNAGITELMLRTLLQDTEEAESPLLWGYLEGLGADVQIVNEPDFFGLQATTLSPHLEKILPILIQWVRNPLPEEDSFQLERKQMMSLIEQEKEDAFRHLIRLAHHAVFEDHPYGLGRYGTGKSLSNLTLSGIQDWIKSQMTGVHPLIVLRGDIKGTAFLQGVVSDLSDSSYEQRRPVKKEIVKAEETSARSQTLRSVQASSGPQNRLVLGFVGPARGTRDALVLQVIENVLSGAAGRLSASLRDQQSLVYEVKLFHEASVSGGAIFAYLAASPENEKKALRGLLQELDRLKRVPLREDEFFSALVSTIGNFYLAQQRGEDYVLEAARNILAGKGNDYEREYVSRIKGITREDIMLVATQYFRVGEDPESQVSGSQGKMVDSKPDT